MQTLSHMYPIHNSIKTLYVIQEVGKIKYNNVFLNIQGQCNKQPGKLKHELVKSHQLTGKRLNDQDFIKKKKDYSAKPTVPTSKTLN